MTDQDLLTRLPPLALSSRLLWTAIVDVADKIDLGPTSGGHRFMVPIVGGKFYSDIEGLSGQVLPGGADRQFLRDDGVKELSAIYEMQTKAGLILSIDNQVIVDENFSPRYALSQIKVEVADGPLAWLKRRLILGTLQSARPQRQAVVIRAFEMTPEPTA